MHNPVLYAFSYSLGENIQCQLLPTFLLYRLKRRLPTAGYFQKPRIMLLLTVLYQKIWPQGEIAKNILRYEHFYFVYNAVTAVQRLQKCFQLNLCSFSCINLLHKMFSVTASLSPIKTHKYLCLKVRVKKANMKPEVMWPKKNAQSEFCILPRNI